MAICMCVNSYFDSYSYNRAHPIVLRARYCLWCMTRIHYLPCTPPHSSESLSRAIIPSKTSAVIYAMFHQSVKIYSKAHCLKEPTLHRYDTSCSSSALCCENIRGIFITHPCRVDGSGMPSHHNHFYALVELTARTAHSDTATVLQLDLVTTVLYCV